MFPMKLSTTVGLSLLHVILVAAPQPVAPLPGVTESPKTSPSQPQPTPEKRALTREEWEKRQAELKGLSPEERRARIREWRRQRVANRPEIQNLTPAERAAKRREFREQLDHEIDTLRRKKDQNGLTPIESRRLKRLEELARRFARPADSPATPGKRINPP